jgi:hypothetical protein
LYVLDARLAASYFYSEKLYGDTFALYPPAGLETVAAGPGSSVLMGQEPLFWNNGGGYGSEHSS